MKLEEVLSTSEIETPRSPRAFVDWFEGLLSRTREIEDKEFKKQMLTHAGLAKKFYEEMFPLYRLLQTKLDSWSDARVRNVLGNQGHDIELTIEGVDSSNIPKRLEITYAVLGCEHFSRMHYFAKHGTTLGWDSTQGNSSPEPFARCCDDIVESTFELVKERIQEKTGKDYGDKAGLVVYVEDGGEFKHSPERQTRLENFFSSYWREIKKRFQVSYLITSFEGKVFELPVRPQFQIRSPKELRNRATDI